MAVVLVTSDGLNLREIPSTAGHVVDQINRGDECAVLGERVSLSGARWLRVHVLRTGDMGWVSAEFTTPKPEQPPVLPPVLPPTENNWDIPASSWEIPIGEQPAEKHLNWVWTIPVVLIVAALILLMWWR